MITSYICSWERAKLNDMKRWEKTKHINGYITYILEMESRSITINYLKDIIQNQNIFDNFRRYGEFINRKDIEKNGNFISFITIKLENKFDNEIDVIKFQLFNGIVIDYRYL